MADDHTASAFADPALGFVHDALDRADPLRKDAEKVAALKADPRAVIAPFWRGEPFALKTADGVEAGFLSAASAPLLNAEFTLFLGMDGNAPTFAAVLPPDSAPGPSFPLAGMGEFTDLRALAPQLSARDAMLLGCARSLIAWHARHGFCANCGAPSVPEMGGWKRACPSCGASHFPRVDPVVIMAVGRGDQLLLGRQSGWPPQFWSCLAGFIEVGETVEQAVRRETYEEAGIRVGAVRYAASQPWPFPSSLMVGVLADALSETISIDANELEDARWFGRDEVRTLLAGGHATLRCPPKVAIAHHLMALWAK